MADEPQNTGVNQPIPAAGESSGVNTPAAEGTVQSQPSATGEPEGQQPAAGETPPQTIPYERFAEKVAESNAKDTKVTELEQQLAVAQATQEVIQRQQGGTGGPADPMAQILGEIDDEYASGKQVKDAIAKVVALIGNVAADVKLSRQCPNYDDLVGEPNAAGQFRPAFQKAVETDPSILKLVYSAPPHMQKQIAYSFAKAVQLPATPEQQAASQSAQVATQAALDAASIPLSPSAIGAGGGAFGKANKIAAMTPEEFSEHCETIKQQSG